MDCEPSGWLKDIRDPEPTDREHCRTVLAHLDAGLPPCTGLAKWRVTERRRGDSYVRVTYFCDDHLPDEYVALIDGAEDGLS